MSVLISLLDVVLPVLLVILGVYSLYIFVKSKWLVDPIFFYLLVYSFSITGSLVLLTDNFNGFKLLSSTLGLGNAVLNILVYYSPHLLIVFALMLIGVLVRSLYLFLHSTGDGDEMNG